MQKPSTHYPTHNHNREEPADLRYADQNNGESTNHKYQPSRTTDGYPVDAYSGMQFRLNRPFVFGVSNNRLWPRRPGAGYLSSVQPELLDGDPLL